MWQPEDIVSKIPCAPCVPNPENMLFFNIRLATDLRPEYTHVTLLTSLKRFQTAP